MPNCKSHTGIAVITTMDTRSVHGALKLTMMARTAAIGIAAGADLPTQYAARKGTSSTIDIQASASRKNMPVDQVRLAARCSDWSYGYPPRLSTVPLGKPIATTNAPIIKQDRTF